MRPKAISLGFLAVLVVSGAFLLLLRYAPVQAQSSSTAPSSTPSTHPMPPAVPQSLPAGLWRVDHNFMANLHIKNQMLANPVQVTPVLYMADGTEYDLAPVTLAPTAVVDIDLNQALSQAPASLAAHVSSYGSAALKYVYPAPGVVSGQLMMLDVPRSLVFTNGFALMANMGEAMPVSQTLEGVWWKHDPGVGGFVSLTNTTATEVKVSVQVLGAHGLTLPQQVVTLAPHAAELMDLTALTARLPGLEDQEGGIRIQYQGMAGDVIPVGGLENDREGYSADIPIWPHTPASQTGKKSDSFSDDDEPTATAPTQLTLGAVGIMTGYPASRLGFPGGTHFTPYVTLRNTTARPLMLKPMLYTGTGGANRTIPLRPEVLAPYQTRQVDMQELLRHLKLSDFDGFINVTYAYTGYQSDLLMAAGSVDQTGNYVFQVLAQGINPGLSRHVPAWTLANGYNTMLTLWNPSNAPEDIMATFYFPDGSGQYQLPVHLEALASANIDVAELVALDEPDAQGRTFPVGISGGSVQFASPQGTQTSMELAVSAAEFNVENATCSSCCTLCGGVCAIIISPSPGYCPLNVPEQMYATEYWVDGTYADVTNEASWSSANGSIATVGNVQNTNKGLTTGVAVGSTTLSAKMTVPEANVFCLCNGYCTAAAVAAAASQVMVGSLVFSITSGGVPNDPLGVVAKQSFNLQIQAKNAQGTVPDPNWNDQNVPFTLINKNTSVGEAAPSSINFSSGTANASMTIVQASGLTNSVREIVVSAVATGTVFYPYVYMNVFGTDEGLVGQITACGYQIPSNAQMVALPYGTSLCGQQVYVANGQLAQTAPVEDVGPWCPNTPAAGNSNTCSCSADPYWTGTAVPKAVTLEGSCNSNGAGIDLGDGTFSAVRQGTNGAVDWKFP